MKNITPLNPISFRGQLRREYTAREIYLKHHGYNAAVIAKALEEGTREEMEHTNFIGIARRIASHHIYDKGPGYYPALRKMEKGL